MSRVFKNSIFCLFISTASCVALLLFENKVKPDCGPSNQRSGIDEKKSCCWLHQVIFVEGINQLF